MSNLTLHILILLFFSDQMSLSESSCKQPGRGAWGKDPDARQGYTVKKMGVFLWRGRQCPKQGSYTRNPEKGQIQNQSQREHRL